MSEPKGDPNWYLLEIEHLRAKIERLTAALDQRHINDQCILDEAIKAATKVKDAENERLRAELAELRRAFHLSALGQEDKR